LWPDAQERSVTLDRRQAPRVIGHAGVGADAQSKRAGASENVGQVAAGRCEACRHSRDSGRHRWWGRWHRREASGRARHKADWYIERWSRANTACDFSLVDRVRSLAPSGATPRGSPNRSRTRKMTRIVACWTCGVKSKHHNMLGEGCGTPAGLFLNPKTRIPLLARTDLGPNFDDVAW